MSFKRYLVLLAVVVFGAVGDCSLSRGMKQFGEISLSQWWHVELTFLNPWVDLGILLLLGYFASYLTSLSWADLTYVLPASALGYILVAVIAKFLLHEYVSPVRWIGIVLIVAGVGFVATGSHITKREKRPAPEIAEVRG
ncbi:MAG TPA: EamA family transporter [Candidatus Koribacter sp.]